MKKKNNKVVENVKENIGENVEKNNSIIFVNRPITTEEEDILGVETSLNRINDAIDDNANIIGIIGDYGSGKSSIVELLKKKRKNVVNINMLKTVNSNDSDTSLIESFLFQMSKGKDNQFAKYISKKLNNNHGMMSLILSDKKIMRNLIVPVILLLVYMILRAFPNNLYESGLYSNFNIAFDSFEVWLQNLIKVIYTMLVYIRPAFLVLSIALVCRIFLKRSVLVSLLGFQNKINISENDISNLYIEIATKITDKLGENEKQLFVISDLDRTNKKDEIRNFIKEIYKFNSLLEEKVRNKLVFIIETKSEETLEIEESENKNSHESQNEFYKKIFSFKIKLNPIYPTDYEVILLNLLKQKEEKVTRIFGRKLGNKLTDEFAYIIKGKNLTIRDLKERLNRSFEVYETLIAKEANFEKNVADYSKCAIVAYLENQYPVDMNKFISSEKNFSDILDNSYIIKQDENLNQDSKIEKIVNLIDIDVSENFKREIAEMIERTLIDEDFKLYFYNYPKGQRIKTSDELYVEQLILYPSPNQQVDNSRIEKAIEGDEKLIERCYKKRKSERLLFPKSIFESEYLYCVALVNYREELLKTLIEQVKWNSENLEESARILKNICEFNIDSAKLLTEYIDFLKDSFKNMTREEIIKARMSIIQIVDKYILLFKPIFVNNDIPLISKEELDQINEIAIKLYFINEKIVNTNNIKYIIEVLNHVKLSDRNYQRAVEIYMGIDNTIKLENVAEYVLEFLTINNKVNDELFNAVCGRMIKNRDLDEKEIAKYLNNLNANDISLNYLNNIEVLMLNEKLNDEILELLNSNKMYQAQLVNFILQNRCTELELRENAEEKLNLIENIYPKIENNIIDIRMEIIRQNLVSSYKTLFFSPYPTITIEEIKLLNNIEDIKESVDFSKVNEECVVYIVEKINNINYTKKEFLDIIEIADYIRDGDLIKLFFQLLKIQKNIVSELTDDDRSYMYKVFKEPLSLVQPENAILFSKKIEYVVNEIDSQLCNYSLQDEEQFYQYIQLIYNLDIPTEQTVKSIATLIASGKEFPIASKTRRYLLEHEFYTEYIIGKIVKNQKVIVNLERIDIKFYVEAYSKTDITYSIMANDGNFLKLIIDKNAYYNIPKEKLQPFYKYADSVDFIRYLFDTLNKNEILDFVVNYLKCDERMSYNLRSLICEDKYIWIIENKDIYDKIWNMLPEASDRTQLTIARNRKFNMK